MASHPSPPRQEPCAPPPNWLALPADVSASILRRLGAVEILARAQHVCSTWRGICRDPSMWRYIDLCDYDIHWYNQRVYCKVCRQAVDRSSGGLLDISLESLADDNLLRYITDRSKHLKRLCLVRCADISDAALVEAAGNIPVLEELDISYCQFSSEVVTAVERLCPLLESFKLNAARVFKRSDSESDDFEAFAIAKSMPGLHHLQIFGNKLTNAGLVAILDGCQHLESLDLRQCVHVNLDADLKRRCSERIKDFQGPNDSTDDYPSDNDSTDDYPSDSGVLDGMSSDDDPYMSSDVEFMSDGEGGDIYGFSGGSDYQPDYDPWRFDFSW